MGAVEARLGDLGCEGQVEAHKSRADRGAVKGAEEGRGGEGGVSLQTLSTFLMI